MPLIKSTLKIGDNSSNAHDNITVDGEFVGNLIPNTDASFDIGSSTKVWNNLYVASISTNIADAYLLYSNNGIISGLQQLQYEGSPYHRFGLGTAGNYYGKLAVLDGNPAPFQSGVSNVDLPSNYQLNIMGNATSGWASGMSFGSSAWVGASIVQKNVSTNNMSDLLFYTKKTTSGNPTLSMSLKTDNRVIIGDWFGGTPTATLTVRDHTKDPLANISAVDNYQFGVYLPVNVGASGGISFGSENFVGSAIVHTNTNGNNEGELSFYTKDNGVFDVSMVIRATGEIGIGVTDPFADLEVEGTIGVSNSFDGGSIEFRMNGATPTNTQELGRVRFGADSNTQASIYGVANENWGGTGLGTNVVISGTEIGGNTESPIAIFDHTQTDFVSPVNVNNSMTALLYYGNGQFLTGIAKGTDTQMQYNDNGVMNGGVVYYEKTTGKVTMGVGSNGFSSKLLIHDSSLNAYTDLASVSSYHLHISGSSSNGQAMGIGFGKDSSGVGGAVLFEDTGSYNKGDLVFLTKSSTSSGVAPVERVRIHANGVDVKGATSSYGGKVAFKVGVNYPQTNSTIGMVTFGSPVSENAMIRGGVPSSWSTASRDTDLSFWITKNGSTTWTQIALMDSDGLTVTGDVEADYFIGDGSQLTNIPMPSAGGNNNAVQYNNGGVFDGSGVYYFNNNGGLSIGINAHTIGGGLSIYHPTMNPLTSGMGNIVNHQLKMLANTTIGNAQSIGFGSTTNVGAYISQANAGSQNQSILAFGVKNSTVQGALPESFLELSGVSDLVVVKKPMTTKTIFVDDTTLQVHADNNSDINHINLRGSATIGQGSSIAFGSSNKTAQIATYNTSSNGYGDLIFRVKSSTTNQATLTEYLRMGGNEVKFSKRIEAYSSVDPALSPSSNSGHQIQLQGGNGGSSGISFGTPSYNSWSVVADQESSTSRRARLKFLYPDTSSTSDTTMSPTSAFCITEDGNVGIHNDDPQKKFVVDGDVRFHNYVGAYTFYQNSTDTPTSGQNLGTIAFGTDVAPYAAYLQVTNYNDWSSSVYRPTKIALYGTKTNNVGSEEIYRWDAGGTSSGHNFKGFVRLTNGSLLLEGGFSIIGSYQANVGALISSGKIEAEDLEINDDAVIAGDLTMGYGGQINCNQYWWRGANTTREKKIELSDAGTYITNGEFEVSSSTSQKIISCDYNSTYGMLLVGTQYGSPMGANFIAGQDDTGLYVEGYGVGGHDTSSDSDGGYQATESSVMTVCNRNASNTQVVMDILAGSGVYDSSFINQPLNYAGWVTTSTSFIRFLNKNRGSSSSNTSTNSVPKRVGRIRGDGSGGIDYISSFTGMHATVTELKPEHKIGMIMVSTGEIWIKGSVETCLPRTTPTDIPKDKRVFGILGELEPEFEGYSANTPPRENESQVQVYSIGEGAILVTNIGGNIENGDYICSSEILGHGMLQDDDLLHNYTVAKCTETINWDDPELETIEHNGQTYKVYLAACTYHCG